MPIISIIVPVYNVEQCLERCVESILAQTFTDFELILVDDGSTDGCSDICDAYARKDSRVRTLHKKNRGVSSARNAGLNIARGDYIAFVDGDDWIHPQMYEILYKAIDVSDAGISVCKLKRTNTIEKFEPIQMPVHATVVETQEILSQYNAKYYSCLTAYVYNKLYCASCFADIRFNTRMSIYEDDFLCLDVLNCTNKVAYIDHVLYYYFQRDNSLIHTYNPESSLLALVSLQHMSDFMLDFGYSSEVNILEYKWLCAYLSNYYAITADCPESISLIKKFDTAFRSKRSEFIRNPVIPRAYKLVIMLFSLAPKCAEPLYRYLTQ